MRFTFLHAADLHLGSPLAGLRARDAELAALFDRAIWKSFEALVDLALAESVSFLVIAGDVFDRDWRDFSIGQAFLREIARLSRAGIPVVMIRGNHDAESIVTRHLPMPEGVTWLGADRPETLVLETPGVAIHGMSFKTRAVPEVIVSRYPERRPGLFNIGLLHTSLDGRHAAATYAPAAVADLVRHGYDYWALGHIHVREVVRAQAPVIAFAGNPQGRSIRETGARGAFLVNVDGAKAEVVPRDLDQARFLDLAVDLAGAGIEDLDKRLDAALEAALHQADGRPAAVRLRLCGPTELDGLLRADRGAVRERALARATALSAHLAIEKLVVSTRAAAADTGAAGDLLAAIGATAGSDAFRMATEEDRRTILGKAPQDLGADRLLTDADVAEAALALVHTRLRSAGSGGGG